MFSIFNKKESFRIGEILQVDMHSHILPGIDDGAADVETSLRLIDGLIAMGYKKLIATPHIISDIHPNTPETIEAAKQLLQTELDKKGYTIPVSYAAEYMLDENFLPLLKAGDLLTFGNKIILVETMFLDLPPNLEEILFQLQTHGYQPLLAHPERYHYVDRNLTRLSLFRDRNCMFQCNALSFTGYYGKREQEIAYRLLDAGLIDFIGSDIHHDRHLEHLQHFTVSSKIARQLESLNYKNLELR
ncbi:tyrosine-protein phosphatase [Albibacterium bauzanense]|uniref:protein-tyrosine-phosphatase n=1 Tax=Albibacterium bauzanense TaxID=653929 RepID=A0A4R1LZ55_9SPHI|nr:CpsB/CapC family capsule biosynthesis tyrosine phosphatase [Albibacterium bauzanense]TCK84866.1 tyrosine-protein phosphatase YwqE [Albibacterium bauzanense]